MKPFRTTHTEQKFCPFCGKQNPTTYKYCIECGYEIPDISFISQNSNIQTRSVNEQNQQPQTIIYAPTVEKKRGYGRLIFFLAVAVLFIYTNPNEKMHLDFVKEIIHKENSKKPSFGGAIERLLEIGLGDERYNSILKDFVKRKNFIFFSLTEITAKEKSEIVAIGLLGNIIALEDVKNSFDSLRIKYDL